MASTCVMLMLSGILAMGLCWYNLRLPSKIHLPKLFGQVVDRPAQATKDRRQTAGQWWKLGFAQVID